MFRWLKEKRKWKNLASRRQDREFRFIEENQNLDTNADHIYEEISDLHFQLHEKLEANRHMKEEFRHQDGPYMVVDIVESSTRPKRFHESVSKSNHGCYSQHNSSVCGSSEEYSSGVGTAYDLANWYKPVDDKSSPEMGAHYQPASSDTGCEFDISYESQLSRTEHNFTQQCRARDTVGQQTSAMTSLTRDMMSDRYFHNSGYNSPRLTVNRMSRCDLERPSGICNTCSCRNCANQTDHSVGDETHCCACCASFHCRCHCSSHHKQTVCDSGQARIPYTVTFQKPRPHITFSQKPCRQERDLSSGWCRSETNALRTEVQMDKHNSSNESMADCRLTCSRQRTDSVGHLYNIRQCDSIMKGQMNKHNYYVNESMTDCRLTDPRQRADYFEQLSNTRECKSKTSPSRTRQNDTHNYYMNESMADCRLTNPRQRIEQVNNTRQCKSKTSPLRTEGLTDRHIYSNESMAVCRLSYLRQRIEQLNNTRQRSSLMTEGQRDKHNYYTNENTSECKHTCFRRRTDSVEQLGNTGNKQSVVTQPGAPVFELFI